MKGGLGRKVVGPSGQRWDVSVTLQPTADIGVVTAHYAQHGYGVEFEMPMPQLISQTYRMRTTDRLPFTSCECGATGHLQVQLL